MSTHSIEIEKGDRFEFGRNWANFLKNLKEERIQTAMQTLSANLGKNDLLGLQFIDIGCGSGLFSLAAKKLGAKVYSFDYDPASVSCTKQLKNMFYKDDPEWTIHEGSILDIDFINRLGKYDIVYSWGVLHHTGNMWKAIENSMSLIKHGGLFFIAIYNKQGWKSKFWWYLKFIYNQLPAFTQRTFALSVGALFQVINIVKYTILLKPQVAIKPLINYSKNRGMSIKHDILDWIGGFPYEFATVNELNDFFKHHEFSVIKEIRTNSLGCNEIIYKKN